MLWCLSSYFLLIPNTRRFVCCCIATLRDWLTNSRLFLSATNEKQNQCQLFLAYTNFPALGYVSFLFCFFTLNSDWCIQCLCLLWLVRARAATGLPLWLFARVSSSSRGPQSSGWACCSHVGIVCKLLLWDLVQITLYKGPQTFGSEYEI